MLETVMKCVLALVVGGFIAFSIYNFFATQILVPIQVIGG